MNIASRAAPETADSLLARMQYQADPLADATLTTILGPWRQPQDAAALPTSAAGTGSTRAEAWQPQWAKLSAVSQTFSAWPDNNSVAGWSASGAGLSPEIGPPLEDYLQAARHLPAWADRRRLEQAETLFMEYGALSVTLLFCSSLPECYVIPDLAAVLHVTGQLEKHTDYRIRATGAMVFPVMMHGGLTAPGGGGVAQILKVRLIHATIRNLILRGSPEAAMNALAVRASGPGDRHADDAGVVAPLPGMATPGNMHQTLFAHGWKTGAQGLPCNQEELAYTLLTFSYVFLRSMRKLGLALTRAEEEAYLHSWNVTGHLLGIERELLADTMDEAEALFAAMQQRGRADRRARPETADPRPALGRALMQSMEQVIPFRAVKSFPTLLTRYLCGPATAQDLGLAGPMSWLPRLLFTACLFFTRAIDWLVRIFFRDFSIARFLTRVLGYHLMTALLMDQTRPLKLPQHVRDRIGVMIDRWAVDPKAPGWMNSLEHRLTTKAGGKVSGR